MTCANCGGNANYVFADPGALPIAYCDADLPEFLRPRAKIGDLPVVSHNVSKAGPDPLAKVKRPARPKKN